MMMKKSKRRTSKSSRRGPTSSNRRRSTQKRELIKNATGKYYAKRDKSGRFKEMTNISRSLKQDVKTPARTTVKPGFGHRGDTPQGKKSRKKRI